MRRASWQPASSPDKQLEPLAGLIVSNTITFRRPTSFAAEFAIAIAILGTVTLWRFTRPPCALAVAEPIPIHLHSPKAMAQIEIEPVRARGANVLVQVSNGELEPIPVKELSFILSNPSAIEPMLHLLTVGVLTPVQVQRYSEMRALCRPNRAHAPSWDASAVKARAYHRACPIAKQFGSSRPDRSIRSEPLDVLTVYCSVQV